MTHTHTLFILFASPLSLHWHPAALDAIVCAPREQCSSLPLLAPHPPHCQGPLPAMAGQQGQRAGGCPHVPQAHAAPQVTGSQQVGGGGAPGHVTDPGSPCSRGLQRAPLPHCCSLPGGGLLPLPLLSPPCTAAPSATAPPAVPQAHAAIPMPSGQHAPHEAGSQAGGRPAALNGGGSLRPLHIPHCNAAIPASSGQAVSGQPGHARDVLGAVGAREVGGGGEAGGGGGGGRRCTCCAALPLAGMPTAASRSSCCCQADGGSVPQQCLTPSIPCSHQAPRGVKGHPAAGCLGASELCNEGQGGGAARHLLPQAHSAILAAAGQQGSSLALIHVQPTHPPTVRQANGLPGIAATATAATTAAAATTSTKKAAGCCHKQRAIPHASSQQALPSA